MNLARSTYYDEPAGQPIGEAKVVQKIGEICAEYPRYGRGTQGVIAIQTTERNGKPVGAILVDENDEVVLVSTGGVLIRTPVSQISKMGRSTQGVRLINLDEGEKLAGLEKIDEPENGDDPAGPAAPAAPAVQ